MIKGPLMPFCSKIQRRHLIKQGLFLSLIAVPLLGSSAELCSPDTTITDPLIYRENLEYIGAFRIPEGIHGDSAATYTEGPITLGPDGKSIFLVGKSRDQAIGELSIPELVNSTTLNDLNMASVIQPFREVIDRPQTGNTQNIDRIGGMEYVDGELIVNVYEYYDAIDEAEHTTLVVRDAANLATSPVDGYHEYPVAAHASGWISPIPENLQALLGGTHITGNSKASPIISRYSVGPSAFVINPAQHIIGGRSPTTIPTSTLLDFSLDNPLGDRENRGMDYLNNDDHTNDLWTRISRAAYGFIAPGTNTYVTIGWSGGHTSGVGYKITQDNGDLCPGPCSYEVADNYNYYWLWDLNDLIAVQNGQKLAHKIEPYAYGEFVTPFQSASLAEILGGAFDSATNILYLTLYGADVEQNRYERLPVIVAYKLAPPP